MSTPAEHAATVEAWVRSRANPLDGPMERQVKSRDGRIALAALVALAERATELEAEKERWKAMARFRRERHKLTETRATELERELADERERFHRHVETIIEPQLRERAERVETALRELKAWAMGSTTGLVSATGVEIRCRAALGETAPLTGLHTRDEIIAEIERIEAETTGSYEEQAGAVDALRWVLGETAPSELPSHCVATSERTIAADGEPFRCAVCDNILVRHDGRLEIAAGEAWL